MFRRSAGSLVCALFALLVAATAARAARAPRIWFPSNRLPLAHATRLGAAAPSQRMEVGVGLKDPHPAAEQALMAAQQNLASPQYHHFLTPAQCAKRFAVARPAFQRTLSWLRCGGATVLDTSAARNFVEISATVSQIDKLFGTTVGSYEAKGTMAGMWLGLRVRLGHAQPDAADEGHRPRQHGSDPEDGLATQAATPP